MRIVPVPGGALRLLRAIILTIPFDLAFAEEEEVPGELLGTKRTGEFRASTTGAFGAKRTV